MQTLAHQGGRPRCAPFARCDTGELSPQLHSGFAAGAHGAQVSKIRSCQSFGSCPLRALRISELCFPSPRRAFITSPASRTLSLARARVASSRTWPAPPSRYFPPVKRDGKSTCRRLHIKEEGHDVRHLLDAMLVGSLPSFIPASQQALTEHRCRRFEAVKALEAVR